MKQLFLLCSLAAVASAQRGTSTANPHGPGTPYDELNDLSRDRSGEFMPAYGKVIFEDGSPASGASIERTCQAKTAIEGKSDAKGRFSLRLRPIYSDTHGISSDRVQGISGGPASVMVDGCHIRAKLAGFRSDDLDLTGKKLADHPELGAIVLHKVSGVEGSTTSATSDSAPKDARKVFDHARDLQAKGKEDEAQASYQKAVSIYPQYAAAWFELGQLSVKKHDLDGARKAYEQAIAADPKFIYPYDQLAFVMANKKLWPETLEITNKLLKLDSEDVPRAWLLNGLAQSALKHYDLAEKSVQEAIRTDPSHTVPQAEYLYGVILMQKNDYAAAKPHLARYLELAPEGPDAPSARGQLAAIQEMSAKK